MSKRIHLFIADSIAFLSPFYSNVLRLAKRNKNFAFTKCGHLIMLIIPCMVPAQLLSPRRDLFVSLDSILKSRVGLPINHV